MPTIRPGDSPIEAPVQPRPVRPIQPTDIILPEYCQNLTERLKHNPKYLTKYRDEAKKQFIDELEEYESLGISQVRK